MPPAPPPPSDFPPPPPRPTAVAIVGTDLVLAAFPASPVQIAHALHRLGYDVVVPASWGDELLAAQTLARLEERGATPAVYCACPRVAERLLATGPELASVMVPLVAPPVAAARYVRAAYGGRRVSITYLGGCGAADDESIDARITPREFLRALHDRGITLGELPRVFEGIIPPDRRRHLSLPGGLPEQAQLDRLGVPRRLACLTSADYAAELAQLVIQREPVLIDVAARLGCACAGATAATPFERAHDTVTRLEPPRSPLPVVDPGVAGDLGAPLPEIVPEAPRQALPPAPRHSPPGSPRVATPARPMSSLPMAASSSPRTPSPPGVRPAIGTPPGQGRIATGSGEPLTGPSRRRVTGFFRGVGAGEQPPRARTGQGMALPRAYVARRRGSGDGLRSTDEHHATREHPRLEERPVTEERELPIRRHVEPGNGIAPPVDPASLTPPGVEPIVASAPIEAVLPVQAPSAPAMAPPVESAIEPAIEPAIGPAIEPAVDPAIASAVVPPEASPQMETPRAAPRPEARPTPAADAPRRPAASATGARPARPAPPRRPPVQDADEGMRFPHFLIGFVIGAIITGIVLVFVVFSGG